MSLSGTRTCIYWPTLGMSTARSHLARR